MKLRALGLGVFLMVVLLLGATGLSAATISGLVKFDGVAPDLPSIKMDADPSCMKKHAMAPKVEVLLLGAGNTMGNVVVSIKSGLTQKSFPTPKDAVVVDQNGCMYSPHVIVAMKDQPIKFRNSDGILHNIHALPKVNTAFNFAMPGSLTMSPDKAFSKSEDPFRIKCDVHPWMGAWIRIMEHPFYAVTSADGKFTLNNVPAGTYLIEAWHEKLGAQTASVTVGAGDTKTLSFAFKK